MFFTDGEILVAEGNDLEKLLEAKSRIERWFEIERRILFEMEIDETKDFPALIIPEGIKYNDLYDCLVPKLAMKSINSDVLKLPHTQYVNVKHIYSEEEVNEKALEQSKIIIQLTKLKNEKASIMKKFAAEISKLEEELNNEANLIAQGYEYVDKECSVIHNFKEKKVYFMSLREEGVMIKSRDMEKQDFQYQLFVEALPGEWAPKSVAPEVNTLEDFENPFGEDEVTIDDLDDDI